MASPQTTAAIERIVIVGGGTAGWMTAAALSKALGRLPITITVIESEEIGSVGVGEATIPIIHSFNGMLGLNQADFMRACNATFKLGIEFVNWGALGESYVHPFTHYGRDYQNLHFHELWLRYAQEVEARGETSRIDDYNLCCVAAKAGRFRHPVAGQASDVGPLHYAFHFDASLYAKYLRSYSEALGVTRVEGKITGVSQVAETGFITSVTLENGQSFAGDLFIDCSGFRGLLIEQTLKSGYDDWKAYLPCDRAVAVPSRAAEAPIPYTRSTADTAGWRWRIPLQHRVGNGYVYASDSISAEDAERALLAGLDGEAMASPRHLSFVTGKRRQFWNRNCVAIGLAAGFMEPLESTSIHLIQTAILKLLGFFPDKGFDQADIDTFNRQTEGEYMRIRDFLILHYKATRRDDTAFWRHCRDMAVPDTLCHAMDLFRSKGRLAISLDHLFTAQSWLSVMIGQGIKPLGYDPLVNALTTAELGAHMRSAREQIAKTTADMPKHADYIAQFCAARGII